MPRLTTNQTRLLAAAVAGFLISAAAILGGTSPWVVPVQTLIGAVAAAMGWGDSA